jgi:hypothetical protein
MLLDPARPSRAFALLAELDRLDGLAPIARLVGVPQDPVWHPEGDVFVHTLMVVDRAREIAATLDPREGEILMLSALCHDLGKPGDDDRRRRGRVRALAHEGASARRTRDWLARLRFPERLVRTVDVLVARHLAPSQLVAQGSGPRAYRRLARKLAEGSASPRPARAPRPGRSSRPDDARGPRGHLRRRAGLPCRRRGGRRPRRPAARRRDRPGPDGPGRGAGARARPMPAALSRDRGRDRLGRPGAHPGALSRRTLSRGAQRSSFPGRLPAGLALEELAGRARRGVDHVRGQVVRLEAIGPAAAGLLGVPGHEEVLAMEAIRSRRAVGP